jgi:hypothetical protein
METEQFTNITTQIAQNLNNQALVTQLLTQLNDAYTEKYGVTATLTKQSQDYQKEIAALQNTNMQLFLKVSQPAPEVTPAANPDHPDLNTILTNLQGAK